MWRKYVGKNEDEWAERKLGISTTTIKCLFFVIQYFDSKPQVRDDIQIGLKKD